MSFEPAEPLTVLMARICETPLSKPLLPYRSFDLLGASYGNEQSTYLPSVVQGNSSEYPHSRQAQTRL